jgi:hypothetical protein
MHRAGPHPLSVTCNFLVSAAWVPSGSATGIPAHGFCAPSAPEQPPDEAGVATPSQAGVRIGLDVGRESHFADVLDSDGERLFSRGIGNDQADAEALLDRAGKHGVPGLVMRRAGDLYPGGARTGRRDACIIAGTARTRRKQARWLEASSDELSQACLDGVRSPE